MKSYLVIDIGGTFTKYARIEENGDILEKGKFPTPDCKTHTLENFLGETDLLVERFRPVISGIAVSLPGIIDSSRGFCFSGGVLAYFCNTPLAEIMEKRYGLPVSCENDGKCAALGEYWMGSLKDCRNGAVLLLGTGVGGGLILNGKLYRGSHFSAGEYSFLAIHPAHTGEMDGYWANTGGIGGLVRCVAAKTGEDVEKLDGMGIFERAEQGEETVLSGLKEYTDLLAIQIFNLNMVLDLDRIAIGGGISVRPLLLQYIKESVEEFVSAHPLRKLTPCIPKPVVTVCRFHNDANLLGALYHCKTSRLL